MQPRFTLIQGGRSETAQLAVATSSCAGLDRVSAATGTPARVGWRVELRRPAELCEAEIEEWRALAARATDLDPFADPDFLATSALHVARSSVDGIAFALAFSTGDTGIERLCGVIPLALPHPMRGGPTATLWQAPLAPRPTEPVFAEGSAGDAIMALLDHLAGTAPQVSLRLCGIDTTGALLADLSADARLRVVHHPTPPSIPDAQFVTVGTRATVTRIERITAPDRIGDAVERYLSADARHARRPLPSDPAAAATVRVVSHLFARRGLIEVALHSARGETVSGAIRLGRAGERVLWRSFNQDDALPIRHRTADIAIAPAGVVEGMNLLRLVVS